MRNKLAYIRENLYILKQEYGEPIDIYKETFVTDFKTGKKVSTKTKVHIKNAIVLPALDVLRGRAIYENIRTQGNVSGTIEIGDRTIIIDITDLPKNFKIETDDYIIVNRLTRYDVKDVQRYEYDAGYIITLKESKGAKLNQILEFNLKSKLIINDSISIVD
jgi:hypothetical protein